jgi:hypothetical protein
MNEPSKKPYTKPELKSCGTVEAITLEQNKAFGPTDGFLFNGNSISNAS